MLPDHTFCFEPSCDAAVTDTCLRCKRGGCAAHVRRHLICGVAYMELCSACAREWRVRFKSEVPAPELVAGSR